MAINVVKFTELDPIDVLEGTDVICIVGDANGDPISKKMTLDQLVLWLTDSGVLGESVSGNHYGNGSPVGVQLGNPGHTYVDRVDHAFYIKETGVGTNTGWVQYI